MFNNHRAHGINLFAGKINEILAHTAQLLHYNYKTNSWKQTLCFQAQFMVYLR